MKWLKLRPIASIGNEGSHVYRYTDSERHTGRLRELGSGL